MTNTNLYTIHEHKDTGIRMTLISTQDHYYYLRSYHWTWFGTNLQFAIQFQPITPSHYPPPRAPARASAKQPGRAAKTAKEPR